MTNIPNARSRALALAKPLRARPRELAAVALKLAREDEQLAFEMFRAVPAAAVTLTPAEIEGLLELLYNWKSTDCFGSFVSGVAWREGTLREAVIQKWTRSENRWTRRAALVSTVPLNTPARGATNPDGEAAKTLDICERLLDDRDDMIVKALSWALRELVRRDDRAVVAFLKKHRDRLAARVIRETGNKLSTGLKNPSKRSKPPERGK